jgi:lysophospholipase
MAETQILTGAQIPLSQLRNDSVDNLMGALSIAAHFNIPGKFQGSNFFYASYYVPECCLYFNHTLYRGNRVYKYSNDDLDAFSSPNFPPLVDGQTL